MVGGRVNKLKKLQRSRKAGEYVSGSTRRFIQWKKKKAWLLFAKCQPNPICSVDLHGNAFYNWGLVASFKTVWKGSKRDTQQTYGKRVKCVFILNFKTSY